MSEELKYRKCVDKNNVSLGDYISETFYNKGNIGAKEITETLNKYKINYIYCFNEVKNCSFDEYFKSFIDSYNKEHEQESKIVVKKLNGIRYINPENLRDLDSQEKNTKNFSAFSLLNWGEVLDYKDVCKLYNVLPTTFSTRLSRNLTYKEALCAKLGYRYKTLKKLEEQEENKIDNAEDFEDNESEKEIKKAENTNNKEIANIEETEVTEDCSDYNYRVKYINNIKHKELLDNLREYLKHEKERKISYFKLLKRCEELSIELDKMKEEKANLKKNIDNLLK